MCFPASAISRRIPRTGEPTGYVVEGPALLKTIALVAPFTREFIVELHGRMDAEGLGCRHYRHFRRGLAAVAPDEGFVIYEEFEQARKLPFRVVGSYYYNRPDFDPVPDLEALIAHHQTELVQAKVLKIMMDGVDANGSAAMLAPYADNPKIERRHDLHPAAGRDIVRRVDAKGIDVQYPRHRRPAGRQSLDAIEAAIAANPPRDRRHTVAHNQLTDPADIPRFAKLGVIAEFSGQWHCTDEDYWQSVTLPRWGRERSGREYRIGEILRQGAHVSLGTDWPAGGNSSVYRPLHAIEIAVTRAGSQQTGSGTADPAGGPPDARSGAPCQHHGQRLPDRVGREGRLHRDGEACGPRGTRPEYLRAADPRSACHPGDADPDERKGAALTRCDVVLRSGCRQQIAVVALRRHGPTPDVGRLAGRMHSSTLWRTVADQKNLVYFFDSATSPNAFWVEFADLDFKEGAPVMKLTMAGGKVCAGNVAPSSSRRSPTSSWPPRRPRDELPSPRSGWRRGERARQDGKAAFPGT